MKSKTITAIIIAAALIIFSAVLFFNKKQATPASFNITGVWKLDTLYATQPVNDSIRELVLAMVSPDAEETYTFKADSSFSHQSSKDSTSEKYYLKENVLYFDNGYGYFPHPIKTMTDSLLEFTNKDSVVFVLKKK